MIHNNNMELDNPHPGILLKEEYLDEMGITPYKLAKATGLTQIHVSELLKGKRNITPKTAFLLGRFFETTPEFWMNLQTHYDMEEERRQIGDRLDKVTSYKALIAA
jgi:addiction module HigA family antidote